MKGVRKVSLRPYFGNLYVAENAESYMRAHRTVFAEPDVIGCNQAGRMTGGKGRDGYWTYLIWAEDAARMAHELSHVILHVFEQADIDPRQANGEPFCYMLSQLMLDSLPSGKLAA